MARVPVAVVGATGEVGQKFVVSLQTHPWFEIAALYASEKSAGKTYADALGYGSENSRWFCKEKPGRKVLDMTVLDSGRVRLGESDLFFSALPSETALAAEGSIAKEKPVVSTASAYRYFDDSFTYLPCVNESHSGIIARQREARGWKGFVVPQPNCTAIGLVMSLKPIWDEFGLKGVIMASMQSVSGAGYGAVREWARQRKEQGSDLPAELDEFAPGVLEGNVIPYIMGEEEKVRRETLRILGEFVGGEVKPAKFRIACKCNRVPVLYGHTESVFIETAEGCTVNDLEEAWMGYRGEPQRLQLPTAPKQPVVVVDANDRPQPRFDASMEGGMVAVIGGVQANAFDNGFQYSVLSHNTELGAAKGAVLAAEYLHRIGLI